MTSGARGGGSVPTSQIDAPLIAISSFFANDQFPFGQWKVCRNWSIGSGTHRPSLKQAVLRLYSQLRKQARALSALAAIFFSVHALPGFDAGHASSLEDSYIAARNHYIEKFKQYDSAHWNQATYDEEESAFQDLQMRLQSIVGRLSINGFSAPGKINLHSLLGEEGFGMVDGLVFHNDRTKVDIFVSTNSLVGKWIHDNSDVPKRLKDALISNEFHSKLIDAGSRAYRFAEITVTPPPGTEFAAAIALLRTNGEGILVPREIAVTLIRGQRIFVANAPVTLAVSEIRACSRIWKGSVDSFDDGLAYLHCYAARAKSQSFFPALVKQAQGLANLLSQQ
jgi:hypothetical protein